MRAYSFKKQKKSFNIGNMRGLLIATTLGLSFMYVYFISSSIFNIVEWERLSEDISSLNSKVSILEADYIKIRGAININIARNLGFSERFNSINFANVSGGSVKGGLSYVNNEI